MICSCLTAQSEKNWSLYQVFLEGSEKNQGFLEALICVFFQTFNCWKSKSGNSDSATRFEYELPHHSWSFGSPLDRRQNINKCFSQFILYLGASWILWHCVYLLCCYWIHFLLWWVTAVTYNCSGIINFQSYLWHIFLWTMKWELHT